MLVPALVLLLILLGGLLSARWRARWAIAIALLAIGGVFIPRVHYLPVFKATYYWRPALRCIEYSSIWLAGHADAPRNVRLCMDSLESNVLLVNGSVPAEPSYDEITAASGAGVADEAEYQRRYQEYERREDTYQKQVAALPRIPLWFGAGLMPLLLPLLIFGGLMLGARRRGFERAEA